MMTTLLIIVLVFGMMCVAAWWMQPPRALKRKLAKMIEEWERAKDDKNVALADNQPIDSSCARELPLIRADFSGVGITWANTLPTIPGYTIEWDTEEPIEEQTTNDDQ